MAHLQKVTKMDPRVQIWKEGRMVVPVKLRRALNIMTGDEVVVLLESDSIRLIPMQQAVNLAQKAVNKHEPKGISLVEELIKAQREEANTE
jgi:AbrB family looped-hinge helix DNA binding protein